MLGSQAQSAPAHYDVRQVCWGALAPTSQCQNELFTVPAKNETTKAR